VYSRSCRKSIDIPPNRFRRHDYRKVYLGLCQGRISPSRCRIRSRVLLFLKFVQRCFQGSSIGSMCIPLSRQQFSNVRWTQCDPALHCPIDLVSYISVAYTVCIMYCGGRSTIFIGRVKSVPADTGPPDVRTNGMELVTIRLCPSLS
jgi:hypothetical protein